MKSLLAQCPSIAFAFICTWQETMYLLFLYVVHDPWKLYAQYILPGFFFFFTEVYHRNAAICRKSQNWLQFASAWKSCILILQFSNAQKNTHLHVEYVLYSSFLDSYTSTLTFAQDPLVNWVMGKSCLGTCFTLQSKGVWVNSVMDVNTV